MITFFTTPKPFHGHIGVIQRNAIESWKRIHPSAEVILFGDEEGAAEAARDLAIRHVPGVTRNEHGTKYLSPIFDAAQDLAHNNRLCYINCDIILLSDFRIAAERVAAIGGRYLMAGQRWDTDITAPVDFYATDWEAAVRRVALAANQQRPPQWIDYFTFSRGLYYKNTPAGTTGWCGMRGIPALASWTPPLSSRLSTRTMTIPTIPTARPAYGRERRHSRTMRYLKADAALQPWKTPRIGLPRKASARTIIIGRS
jgi:hypothetical protein